MSQLSAAVEVDDPLVEVPTAMPTEQEIRIGNYIAELIPDEATLQIGVGGIPNAVIRALENHKNLGLHTEAMTDGVLPLLEKGIIDNSRKAVLLRKSVASLALGSKALYKFLDHNEDVLFKDVAWTNDPLQLPETPGHVNQLLSGNRSYGAGMCRFHRQEDFSGVGGQHDFCVWKFAQ